MYLYHHVIRIMYPYSLSVKNKMATTTMILIIMIMIIKIILATIVTIESTSDTLSVQEVSVRLMLWSPWGEFSSVIHRWGGC